MKRLFQMLLACSAMLPLMANEASAAEEWSLSLGVEDFRWREFSGGSRLLEESGVRYVLGLGFESPLARDALTVLNLEGRFYFGSVDYDGRACNISTGACTPATSETDYDGVMAEGSIARRYPSGAGSLEIFGAAGFDAWTREIKSTAAARGGTEDWSVIYAAVGAGWHARAYSMRAGVRLPLAVDETTDFGVNLEPEGRTSLFLRFAATVRDDSRQRWSVQAYYESYRFDESDHVFVSTSLGLLEVWQPESRQDVLGLRLLGHWR